MVAVFATVLAVVAGLVLPAGQPAAQAGPGSNITGLVWADTDRDGVRDTGEAAKAGVTVQLLASPGGAVIATTTTAANGTYSFPNAADGTYVVRVDALGPFRFPDAVGIDNDFVRTGAPGPGQPERGATLPFTITGATVVTGLNAGMQPIADLVAERLPATGPACEGFAVTGLPPFDATDGPGLDSGPGNCVVRTGDTVLQNYSASLTGLPTGASVPNVVMEFTVSSPDGAQLELAGPTANGLPAGCLGAANGAVPASSRILNANGSITVICNVGTMSSNVTAVQLAYRFTTDTPIPSRASIAMRTYAPGGEAGTSASVVGPVVEVTGTAQWDLRKVAYPYNTSAYGNAGPDFAVLTVGGVPLEGYFVRYMFSIVDLLGGTGGTELQWPVTFTDVMPEFPNARIADCRARNTNDVGNGTSPWTLTCPPTTEVQGADGWNLSIRPNSGVGGDTGQGHMIMTVFVPIAEMNRAINPAWQPGDPLPTGTFDFDNRAQDTDHWSINGGALNFGDGHEPGWDGTGNNLATRAATAAAPRWDLYKSFRSGPVFSTQTVNGVPTDGFIVEYNMGVLDQAGADNVGPWLDRPVTFKDRLVTHPGAVLLSCRGNPNGTLAVATCETGVQPADGWDISVTPNQVGFNGRRVDIIASLFIPMDAIAADPCQSNVTLDLRNEAVGSEHWTAQGQPNNGTGFEPGWDGTTATGNNLSVVSVRPAASECGTLTGDKQYIATETGGAYGDNPNQFRASYAGHTLNTRVSLSANNNRVRVTNLELCDVFDVSTQFIRPGGNASLTGTGSVDTADYVLEYAVGPNSVDTQAGPFDPVANLFPSDTTSLTNAAATCRTHPGPWSTNPATFGADWRDKVNMMRVRPIDPTLTEVGPFSLRIDAGVQVRGVYNGGPDSGQTIPHRIRLSNAGGWPNGTATGLSTVVRERRYEGPQLQVDKNVSPATYVPGASVVWDLNVLADRTTQGMTMLNLQVIDTVPAGLHFDLACTQALLPAGVTLSYNPANRQAIYSAGDIPITSAGTNQWIFHPTVAGARRLRICTTVDSLAQPGDTHVNTMQATATNSTNAPTASATIQIVGSGQMGISKRVDKPLVVSGESYNWFLEWGNTSTVLAFLPPDVIDVLPWNGDAADDALSRRDQFATDYQGLAEITGALAAPTYVRGGTGDGTAVPGTWYYSTADPSTINHDPRAAGNADPAAAGGVWLTASEVADFGDVSAVRFVSSEALPIQSRVQARIPAVSTSDELDNVYVNRAMIFSATFANQPLLSNEPYVLMPGFTLGDMVWLDPNGNGRFDTGEQGVAGVTVQVRDVGGTVVATVVTDAGGRWSVASLPAGTYTAHIPAAMFAPGAPLADTVVRTVGSSTANGANEGIDNNNTPTANPLNSGLTSSPVTLSYVRDGANNLTGGNGPGGDDVARRAGALIPDSFTNFTVDLALLPGPGVDIEKATNGQDADASTGPNVTVGGDVRWTYVVTNTGDVNLTNITVVDDMVDAADIDCDGTGSNIVAGPLAPGATFTCVATGTAVEGQYENLGSVTALDPTLVAVADEDPSHYFGIAPEVDIEKATNGQDADSPTGPLVAVGGGVRWTYVVTNTGSVPLTNVTVADNLVAGADIDCDGTDSNVFPGPLDPDESFTCVASGVATAGQYANLGTVTGTAPATTDVDGNPVAGAVVVDEDASHYFGAQPSVDIEKATNGQDADIPPGPLVAAGGDVQWTYAVTNTGNVPLTDVTVTDNREAAADIDCDGTGGNVIAGPLAPNATFTCVVTGTAAPGQYANLGTVSGTGPATTGIAGETVPGPTVSDGDASHYFGSLPAVDIEKSTNGQDADDPTGPFVDVGGAVRWTYVVTNTGNVPLTAVTVTDDLVAAADIDCDGTGSNVVPGPLAPAASFTCVATGTATSGQYANVGAVTGVGPDTTDAAGNPVPGVTVDDDDASHYFGAEPAIDIEKATNGQDADDPTGPLVTVGGEVRWTYVVTNTGNVPLTAVTVLDDLVAAADIDCDDTGSNVVPGPLAPDESFSCVATGVAVADQYANLGSVTGTAPATTDDQGNPIAGAVVDDEDMSHYFGIEPSLDIEKRTNTQDADTPTGPLVAVGGDVRWVYLVTNTGNVPLTDVTITDDLVASADIDCAETGTNVIPGPLAPGDGYACVATGTAVEGQYANVGTVTGIAPETTDVDGESVEGEEVSDQNPSHYFGAAPEVDVEKSTNGEDADEPTGPSITVGDAVEWTYVVTNTGNVDLVDVTVTDDVVAASDIDCDDTGSNLVSGPLEPGDSITCVATGTATVGQYANLGSVVATGPETTGAFGEPVPGVETTDEDWSHYIGTAVPAPPAPLPVTGGSIGPVPFVAGAILLGGGLLFLLLARRRKDGTSEESEV